MRSDLPAIVPDSRPAAARILLIDDEPRIREFISRALAGAGYATDSAATGGEGLRRARACGYDLVILDLVLPDLDGRDVLARLAGQRPGQAVLVLSCLGDVAAKADCLALGAQDYLPKPFSLAELLARVHAGLGGGAGQLTGPVRAGGLTVRGLAPDGAR